MALPTTSEVEQLRQAVNELSFLNTLALEIGRASTFDDAVHTLVSRSRDEVGAEQGVVTLVTDSGPDGVTFVRTRAGTRLDALRPDEQFLGWMGAYRRPLRTADPAADLPFPLGDGVRSVLCVPLVSSDVFLGVLTLYNKIEGAFTAQDEQLMTIVGMQSAQTLDVARKEAERARVASVFGRHTAPAVVEELLRYDADPPSRRTQACVMFLDIRGFTSYAEHAQPEEVVDFLDRFFSVTIEAVTEREGIVHQLLGDGFMAIFGAPIASERDCLNAVEASLDIVRRVEAEVEAGRLLPLRVGVGLHAGPVIAGTVGSAHHREYKVTGDVVNVAARVEGLNKTYGSQVLVTSAVWDRLPSGGFEAEPLRDVELRGRADRIDLYRLV